MSLSTAYIGLGSNLDEPRVQIETARQSLTTLPESRIAGFSPLYASKAVGPEQPDYINAVACLHTVLAPLALLDALQAIERAQNRVRKEHWGPRTIDLDLLLFDNQQIDSERLSVPHPWLCHRNFVIVPLYDLAPGLILPDGTTLQSLWETCSSDGLRPLT